MAYLHENFATGTLTADPSTTDPGTISSAEFNILPAVSGGDVLAITLDPEAVNGDPEVVYCTAHTASATSLTADRGEDGTGTRAHPIGTTWVAAISKTLLDGIGTAASIDDLAITTEKLEADIIDGTKLADNAVDTEHLTNLSVTTAKLDADAVTADKIGDDEVKTEHILDGTITNTHISATAAIDGSKLNLSGAIDGADIIAGTVGTTQIADSAITVGKIGTSAVTNDKISSMDAAKLTGTLPSSSVGTNQLVTGAVTNDKIALNTITQSRIANESVGPGELIDTGAYTMYSLTAYGGTGNCIIDGNTITSDADFSIYSTGSTDDLFLDAGQNLYIGNSLADQVSLRSNDVRLDDTTNVSSGQDVVRNSSTGRLSFILSRREYKKDIKDLQGLTVDNLRPRTFKWRKEYWPPGIDVESKAAIGAVDRAVGFVAEEAAEADERFAKWREDDEVDAVNWQVITTVLVAEVQNLKAQLAELTA
jgi:hypothetical protein